MTHTLPKVTPNLQFTTPDGLLTREGGNLLREIVDSILRPSIPSYTAAEIAEADSVVNKRGSRKEEGGIVYDSTNRRIMVARGDAATDPWDVADASATVTPS